MKILAYVILAGLLIGAGFAAQRFAYSAGWNGAITEMQQDSIEQQNAAIEQRMAEWVATQAAAEPVIIVEEKIVEKIRVVEKEVPKIVEKFIQPECRDLGLEYAGLLNAAVRASNQRSDPSAPVATELDDPL